MFQQHPQQHNHQAFHARAERHWHLTCLLTEGSPEKQLEPNRSGLDRCFYQAPLILYRVQKNHRRGTFS